METLGTAQNRKIYGRHGVTRTMYGLSFANLKNLAKKLKNEPHLADPLWQTGNHDCRILACMIADVKQMSPEQLDSWAQDLDNYVITDAFSGMVVKTAFAAQKAKQWTSSAREWIASAGWNTVAALAMKNTDLGDDFFTPFLQPVRQSIHNKPNRVRYSMNNALIAIAVRNEHLQKAALKVADAIGKVEVDHGDTSCKTPDARSYILKTVARRKK